MVVMQTANKTDKMIPQIALLINVFALCWFIAFISVSHSHSVFDFCVMIDFFCCRSVCSVENSNRLITDTCVICSWMLLCKIVFSLSMPLICLVHCE